MNPPRTYLEKIILKYLIFKIFLISFWATREILACSERLFYKNTTIRYPWTKLIIAKTCGVLWELVTPHSYWPLASCWVLCHPLWPIRSLVKSDLRMIRCSDWFKFCKHFTWLSLFPELKNIKAFRNYLLVSWPLQRSDI